MRSDLLIMVDSITQRQLVRYASVGIVSNLMLYLAYLGLTAFGLGHKTAMTIAYVTGVTLSFVMNRNWSFGHSGAAHWALARYVAAYVFGYLLNLGLLLFGVDYLNLPHQAVQAVAVFIVAGTLFIMHKFWVFAPSDQRSTA